MARVKLSVLYPSLSTSSPTHVGQHRHADASSSSCLASPTVAASPRSPPSRLETGRSEERRVGKEGRSRGSPEDYQKEECREALGGGDGGLAAGTGVAT